jgi:phenylacetic acid degradation protein/carnitine operon protein CaiE
MDNVILGDECIIGALTFIKADTVIPRRSLVAGNPGKIIKEVTDEMISWKSQGTMLYQSLPGEMKEFWRECEPLREDAHNSQQNKDGYKTWNESKLQP